LVSSIRQLVSEFISHTALAESDGTYSASRLRRFHVDLHQEASSYLENKMASEPAATVADLDIDNEQYDSAEDEDFQLDPDQEDAGLTGSDSDDEATEPAAKRRKTGPNKAATEDKELDSGDEAMIQKVKARKEGKQRGKKSQGTASDEDEDDVDFDDDDEGGPGDFVRTRAMRMRMCVELLRGLFHTSR
jgi:hypothetical protein